MVCRERERLFDDYATAIAKNAELAPAIAKLKEDGWSQEWWNAVMQSRERTQTALVGLYRHQATHGC